MKVNAAKVMQLLYDLIADQEEVSIKSKIKNVEEERTSAEIKPDTKKRAKKRTTKADRELTTA